MKENRKTQPDKNLLNTVEELNARPVTGQEAQQAAQARSDRRKEAQDKSGHR